MDIKAQAEQLARQLAKSVTESVGTRFNFDREDILKISHALRQARAKTWRHDVIAWLNTFDRSPLLDAMLEECEQRAKAAEGEP